jgi:hypothetical protein
MEHNHSGEFSQSQVPFLIERSAKPDRDTFGALARIRKSINASDDSTKLCPLCPFSADQPNEISNTDRSSSDNIGHGAGNTKNMCSHIAGHLESIALLSLPVGSDSEEMASNAARSQGAQNTQDLDEEDLLPAMFFDRLDPGEEIPGGTTDEPPPKDDDLINEGWAYVFESSYFLQKAYKLPDNDPVLSSFAQAQIANSHLQTQADSSE